MSHQQGNAAIFFTAAPSLQRSLTTRPDQIMTKNVFLIENDFVFMTVIKDNSYPWMHGIVVRRLYYSPGTQRSEAILLDRSEDELWQNRMLNRLEYEKSQLKRVNKVWNRPRCTSLHPQCF